MKVDISSVSVHLICVCFPFPTLFRRKESVVNGKNKDLARRGNAIANPPKSGLERG